MKDIGDELSHTKDKLEQHDLLVTEYQKKYRVAVNELEDAKLEQVRASASRAGVGEDKLMKPAAVARIEMLSFRS